MRNDNVSAVFQQFVEPVQFSSLDMFGLLEIFVIAHCSYPVEFGQQRCAEYIALISALIHHVQYESRFPASAGAVNNRYFVIDKYPSLVVMWPVCLSSH